MLPVEILPAAFIYVPSVFSESSLLKRFEPLIYCLFIIASLVSLKALFKLATSAVFWPICAALWLTLWAAVSAAPCAVSAAVWAVVAAVALFAAAVALLDAEVAEPLAAVALDAALVAWPCAVVAAVDAVDADPDAAVAEFSAPLAD